VLPCFIFTINRLYLPFRKNNLFITFLQTIAEKLVRCFSEHFSFPQTPEGGFLERDEVTN